MRIDPPVIRSSVPLLRHDQPEQVSRAAPVQIQRYQPGLKVIAGYDNQGQLLWRSSPTVNVQA
jgi:hypothetical protein